ncbi:Zn-dependent exopeptidase [Patellaria atrata CBS 101060]|uniref:Peptide hydrolase n=1 Tax=Patellaria atrata CBS 101060 TaxID=1346257 RepID=A0A9P4VXC5_9PEZI|nr:Zn-dependent exopeptidase [Patellaria atrata CBS 101060]
MKPSISLLALMASSAVALTIPTTDVEVEVDTLAERKVLYVIELAPGETKQVTEEEKWELKKEGKHFIDITDYQAVENAHLNSRQMSAAAFPTTITQQTRVNPLLSQLNKANLQSNLQTFTNYQNRYYRSSYGQQSSQWLLQRVQAVISASGSTVATARAFTHSWGQSSVIATIPGTSTKTIIIGSHQDSINLNSPSTGRAPGADDDGSGTVTILEALRVLLTDSRVKAGQAPNTIEFHWYAAEEGGLLGSQAIFNNYKSAGRNVKAMLNQDMTGYIRGTLDAGARESVGIVTDYVDASLTEFIRKVITAYCTIPYVNTQCGYACSDHASASRAGYPSAFVIEAKMEYTSDLIHTTGDTLSTVSYDHMIQHARMTTGFVYELAFATSL